MVTFLMITFFCTAEAAFVSVNHMAVRTRRAAGDRRAEIVDRLIADRPRLIWDLLMGINLSTVSTSVLITSLVEEAFGAWAIGIGAAVLVLMILLFAEVVPKAIAYSDPLTVALRLARPVAVASTIFRPLSSLIGAIPAWLSRRTPEKEDDLSVTEESLTEMLRLGAEQGELAPEAPAVISGILATSDKPVSEVMIPFEGIVMAPAAISLDELTATMARSGYSRIPVYGEDPRQVAGVVHSKDVFARLYQNRPGTAAEIIRPLMWTRPDRAAGDLLSEMQSRRQHIAAVTNAVGRLVGLVTIQDLLEEIVGEIQDEQPAPGADAAGWLTTASQ